MIPHSEIKNFLLALGFSLEEGTSGVLVKKYLNHNYSLRIDFTKEEIDYGDKITLGDKTTCNFKASENFVVLECVNRLLEKGYAPEHITLEKDYPLGHKLKGKLDILITDEDGKAYLMIECKTWGTEFDKAAKKTLSNGGQLLSYFQQDKSAQYLCLYSSRIEEGNIQTKYGVIKVEPEFATATNTEEVFELWNKNLKDNGIFEATSTPYNIVIKALTKERLTPLTKDDSSRIFNQFAEILRHNVVSDKPNAFNKLITLLLCKIVDEDRGDADELHFQWLENDTNISLQKRLNDLYKEGMERYLTKVVTDYSDSDVESIVGLDTAQRDIIKHMITELRLKKNNEFAFKEVFNDSSFEENSKVLKEVVELFQPYQVRYNKKQQFLGDFFELLLNTSIKQEAGQFFTPVPIARFIINSIPVKELMINKIEKGDSDFIPYVIDYAVGSGHFLTEAMDEIHNKVKEIHQSGKYTKPSIKNNLSKWSQDYDWAYDFVYGIEKDYRLVKTAKVSCFLNGDGLARIFNADGLANFQTDTDYRDKLKLIIKGSPKDNQQFEVLIANPPYSVSAFRNTLKDGDKSFDLYKRLTEDSSEIECLFIERAKQLLKDGGYAGIILPSSILSNGGIYEDAREIILKYFKLVAITEFSSGTFMATGTNTVTLFLERRNNADWQKIEHAVNTFFSNMADVTCNGIEAPFSKYIAHVYKTISLDDYASFIRQKPNDVILKHELFIDYRKAFDNSTPIKNLKKKAPFKALTETEQEAELNRLFFADVIKVEKEKLLYFILAYPQKTLLIKANPTGKNDDEKEFLGYEFSNRRGHEGIKAYSAKTIQQATKLYDENASLNPEKANTYVYNAFLKNDIEVSEGLQSNISYQQLIDMLNFERVEFTKSVSLAVKKKQIIESQWPIVQLGSIAKVQGGKRIPLGHSLLNNRTKHPYIRIVDFDNQSINVSNIKFISAETFNLISNYTISKDDVYMSIAGTIGLVGIVPEDLDGKSLTENAAKIVILSKEKLLKKYLVSYLSSKEGQADIYDKISSLGTPKLALNKIAAIKIPLPTLDIQNQIVDDIKRVEIQAQNILEKIKQMHKNIADIIVVSKVTPISSIVELRKEKIEPQKFSDSEFNYLGLEHIESNTGKILEWKTIKGHTLESTKNVFKKGDLLYGKLRPYLNKVYIAEFDGICSTDILVLKTNHAKLLKYIFLGDDFVKKSSELMKGVSLPRLQVNEFLHFQIHFPSKEEYNEVLKSIESTEIEIQILENELLKVNSEKESILKKYL